MSLRRHGPNLYGWGRLSEKWGFDFNGTAVVCDDAVLVVDPVEPTLDELAGLQGLGSHFVIVLLNADHERHSAELAEALNAAVYVHKDDKSLLKNPNVETFEDGHVFPGGWRVIQLSALKTPGECALYHDEQRALILGDALIGDPVTGLRFVPPMKIANHTDALRSVSKLLDLRVECLILSDGFALPHGGGKAIQGFMDQSLKS